MSEADDLGDFFAEIKQIEVIPTDTDQIQSDANDQVEVNQIVAAKASETFVTSAPPVLNVSQNHAVYTYDFGDHTLVATDNDLSRSISAPSTSISNSLKEE